MVEQALAVILLIPFVSAQTARSDDHIATVPLSLMMRTASRQQNEAKTEVTIGSNGKMTRSLASRDEQAVLAYTCKDAPRQAVLHENEWQLRCREFLYSVYSLSLFLRTKAETPSDWPRTAQVHVFANDVCSQCIHNTKEEYAFDDRVNISIHDFNEFLLESGHEGSVFAQVQSRMSNSALVKVHIAMHPIFSQSKRLILMDADTLFADDVRKLWSLFSEFNATQEIGLAPEQMEHLKSGWYKNRENMKPCERIRCAPFFKPYGLNSGVVLLDLDRIRISKMMGEMAAMAKKYDPEAFPLADQDFYNAYGFHHPDRVFELPCTWNVRTDSLCHISKIEPVQIFHGSRFKFHHRLDQGERNAASIAWALLGETLWPSSASVVAALRQNVSKLLDEQGSYSYKRPWPR